MTIIGWNSGRCIGKSGLAADSSGQKIPGLHLSVAYNFRGERAIGTYQESCGCQHQPMSQRIAGKESLHDEAPIVSAKNTKLPH
jgi:hypothetical protein